jgi:hypothetical protein
LIPGGLWRPVVSVGEEKTLTFGLDAAEKAAEKVGLGPRPVILSEAKDLFSLEIRWPDGTRETRKDVPAGSHLVLEQSKPLSPRTSGTGYGGSAAQRKPKSPSR